MRRGKAEESSMVLREAWPHCGSRWDKRNGHIHTGKQHHRGRACGRDFVRNPGNHSVPEEQCLLIKRLLLENISLRGIGRAAGVGLRWLLQLPFNCTLRQRVSRLARATSHSLKSSAITLAPLNISFVMTISPNVQHYQDSTTEI